MLKYALIAGLIMVQAPFTQKAEAGVSLSDIKNLIKNATSPEKLCAKGYTSFFNPSKSKLTVRSLNGGFCLIPYVAAQAEKRCKGVGDYNQSQCHANALRVLQNKNPDQVIKEASATDPEARQLEQQLEE